MPRNIFLLFATAACVLGWVSGASATACTTDISCTISNPTGTPTTLVEAASLGSGSASGSFFSGTSGHPSDPIYWGSNVGGVNASPYSGSEGDFYSTTGLTVSYSAAPSGLGTVTLVFNTTFAQTAAAGSTPGVQTSDGISVDAADIFIKSGTSSPALTSIFNYGIALGDTALGGAAGDGGKAAGLYSIDCNVASVNGSGCDTSNEVYGSHGSKKGLSSVSGWYGGSFGSASSFGTSKPCAVTDASCTASENSPTVLTTGTHINSTANGTPAIGVCTSGPECGFNATSDTLTVKLTALDGGGQNLLASIFSDFDIFWGTGDCSNAPIWGNIAGLDINTVPVPEPSSLALLATAAIGFRFMRRRKRKGPATA